MKNNRPILVVENESILPYMCSDKDTIALVCNWITTTQEGGVAQNICDQRNYSICLAEIGGYNIMQSKEFIDFLEWMGVDYIVVTADTKLEVIAAYEKAIDDRVVG